MKKKLYSPEQIRKLLADRNIKEVSRQSGVGYQTLMEIRQGKDSRASTLGKLTRYLDGKPEAA